MRVLDNTSPSETPGEATVAAPAPAPAGGYHPGTAAQSTGLNGPEDSSTDQELLCIGFVSYQVLIVDSHCDDPVPTIRFINNKLSVNFSIPYYFFKKSITFYLYILK